MSVLQLLVKELQKIQKTRAKFKMDEGVVIGLATRIRAFTITADLEERQPVPVILRNFNGILHITYTTTYSTNYIPLDVFHYGESMNNELTVYCHNINNFPYTKIIFEMGSIEEVENFIAAVKLRPRPRVNTYEHDGNVTSSSPDSSDSGTTGTKGVDNSFDSNEPSPEEN